jgi:hypothetical protein
VAFLASIDWLALVLFTGLVLAVAVLGLTLAGHFPAERRVADLDSAMGRAVLVGSTAVAALAAAKAIGVAWAGLPPAASVIGAGAALLAAPIVLQQFPDSIVDGRRGLVMFAGAGALLVLAAARTGL